MALIRIFPHSPKEFRSSGDFSTWLLTALKSRNGVYELWSAKPISRLSRGSIVLFRYANEIVGEGIVSDTEKFTNPVVGRTEDGKKQTYEASVTFSPSSIRMFAPAIPIKKVEAISQRKLTVARTYFNFDWDFYPKLLALHIDSQGSFL